MIFCNAIEKSIYNSSAYFIRIKFLIFITHLYDFQFLKQKKNQSRLILDYFADIARIL